MFEAVVDDRPESLGRGGNTVVFHRVARGFRDPLERPATTSPMTPMPRSAIDAGSGTELIWIVASNWPLVGTLLIV
jgi:hypothetical protein